MFLSLFYVICVFTCEMSQSSTTESFSEIFRNPVLEMAWCTNLWSKYEQIANNGSTALGKLLQKRS